MVDITDALKAYKIRSEIERAFFFHLFYEILRQQFGLVGSNKEKDIFERKGSQVDIPIIISSRDIKAVIEGRAAFENATQAERDKWMRQREQRIIYHAGASNLAAKEKCRNSLANPPINPFSNEGGIDELLRGGEEEEVKKPQK